MSQRDNPFTGEWTFNVERSDLSSPAPKKWHQQIFVTSNEVQVREDIIGIDGSLRVVSLDAKFDGTDYPVTGSPVADVIAHTFLDNNNVSGVAKKNNGVSLRETLTASSNGETLTLIYSVFVGSQKVALGVAVSDRANP
jgi:hypothetical protein